MIITNGLSKLFMQLLHLLHKSEVTGVEKRMERGLGEICIYNDSKLTYQYIDVSFEACDVMLNPRHYS